MSGLELIARDSKSEIEKNAEAAAVYFSEVRNRDDDERNWSFSYLREQLLVKNSQELFRRYQVRVQHALFVELLVFNLFYNAISLGAFLFLPDLGTLEEVSRGAVLAGRICRGIGLFVHGCVFAAACREALFRSPWAKITAAALVLACMVATEMGTTVYRLTQEAPQSSVRQTFYLLLTTSVLLPFPRKLHCLVSGTAVITMDLALSGLSSFRHKSVVTVLVADGVLYGTTLLVGISIRYLLEVMGRRAFLDRRECVESRIKIETEKNQEEKFLQSILPIHIAREVRQDIRSAIKNMNQLQMNHKPFNKLYVEKHKDVSILYADIVNSMLLAASLKVSDLVATLNDLFGRFDDSAEKNDCMRIKLLGDCYYCVSGILSNSSRHADNCVAAGLDMIDIIRSVREKRGVDVDMRIGVHTGDIFGGLLGLRKWQFDIWSRDVTIAGHMEQAGVPGQVHITKATKNHLEDNTYDIRPGDGHLRDAYLQAEGIETYLIAPKERPNAHLDRPDISDSTDGVRFQRQIHIQSNSKNNISRFTKRQSSNEIVLPMSRRGAIGYSLHQYRKMVSEVNKIIENTIDKMALSKNDQWCSSVGIHPLFLTFRESGRERAYLEQPDPLFKHYLLCVLIIFSGMTAIHLLIMSRTVLFWITYSIVLLLIVITCMFAWVGYIWSYFTNDDNDNLVNSTALKISRTVWKTTSLRIALWLAISSMVLFCSIIGLNECLDSSLFQPWSRFNSSFPNTTYEKENKSSLSCAFPWFYTLCASLGMTTTSVFLRIHFLLKLALNGVSLAAFWYTIDIRGEEVFRQQTARLVDWEEFDLPMDQSHCYYLTFVLLILHVLDRQVEYICRLDYLMKVRLKSEQEEASTMELLNRILLHNILPPHVSRFYLNRLTEETEGQRGGPEAAYHEERCAVAVLFASIPSFSDFYYEDGQNEEGLRCIQLLNEIICDFDLLLGERQFQAVEKIKTIGSTYMAACGLQAHETGYVQTEENPVQNVATLAKFAVAMMFCLQELNKDAMQDFQLRVGISVGPVMAGVVGTVKPQYDIWGDTVNVASRMDSTGVIGRIQVTKEVSDFLSLSGSPYQCECRGDIFVKGKGNLTTYLLLTPYDEPDRQTTSL